MVLEGPGKNFQKNRIYVDIVFNSCNSLFAISSAYAQEFVRKYYKSIPVQAFVALLIVLVASPPHHFFFLVLLGASIL